MDKPTPLTNKQQYAYDLMAKGKNIFLTGPSGTGKSLVISMFKKYYEGQRNIVITSTTGISAVLIGGVTLHSYLGIGLGTETVDELTDKILKRHWLKKRWISLDTLIIDEISMLPPDLFDKLNMVAKNVRSKNMLMMQNKIYAQPFGGIQLICSGDFLQLPVVNCENFCFEAKSWPECIDETIYLTDIVRQSDVEFQSILNDLRFGQVTDKAKKLLTDRVHNELKNDLGIRPTRIYTTNRDVDELNEKELDKLAEKENCQFFEYEMQVSFNDFQNNHEQALEKAKKSCLAPDKLQLCVDAQVMLLSNFDIKNGLANGSRGVVIGFTAEFPIVRFMNGEERVIDYYSWEIYEGKKKTMTISQIPLKLAYACTVHKSQGLTLDCAEVDLTNTFAYGQGYVALSRVKNKEGLKILGIDFAKIRAHPKAVEFYKKLLK